MEYPSTLVQYHPRPQASPPETAQPVGYYITYAGSYIYTAIYIASYSYIVSYAQVAMHV